MEELINEGVRSVYEEDMEGYRRVESTFRDTIWAAVMVTLLIMAVVPWTAGVGVASASYIMIKKMVITVF